ncbi:hypothetical protein BGZ94_003959 [Podila epigama]|nr:hypothetical protein BGZ94_003959 [Podila epigama]
MAPRTKRLYPIGTRLISSSSSLPKRSGAPPAYRKPAHKRHAAKAQQKANRGSKDRILSDTRSRPQPVYVTAPTVSGEDMVNAIVQGQRLNKSGEATSGTDPFVNGFDPFANQLEAAIKASLKSGTGPHRRFRKDLRHDRANGLIVEDKIPDLQAEYLVSTARWESVKADDVRIKNVTPKDMPKVAELEHGLDRVLFNPGVHWLQDPRSAVFNFDPYLRSICQPKDFDYTALQEYKTSSRDIALLNATKKHRAKYMGSTSSMTSVLSQFYFLISGWKPLKTSHLSGAFAAQPKGFTRLSRAPTTINLVYKGNGMYAIDADKTFDSSTVLMQLGKSMEKMLTTTPQEFSRFTKKNSWKVTQAEREAPEAFNYITADKKFMLRSQLDCVDPRLPGKTFDLKTRAAVAIRLDVQNYEQNQGYQLRKSHGILESFEREYYDMMRSAFLKYSLQVRIGQMDGIFVAFHNTARIFGFQYISLDEMDSRLFGSAVMGDECFRNQLRVLHRTLDEITSKYPEQDLNITFDTDESIQSMNVWVETKPLGVTEDVDVKFDENGAPEMQPGAELALWQVVCYSQINGAITVGPFDLSDRGTDEWELHYKIGELNKPHMMSEYRRLKAMQAEIMSNNEEKKAIEEAAAASNDSGAENEASVSTIHEEEDADSEEAEATRWKEQKMAAAAMKRDVMRDNLRRISQEGKKMEEHQERLEGKNEPVIWEPKGYVKVSQIATAAKASGESLTAAAAIAGESTTTETTKPTDSRSISDNMVGRLQMLEESHQEPSRDERLAMGIVVYHRPSDSEKAKIPFSDFDLIRKNMSGGLKHLIDLIQLEKIKEKHKCLTDLKPYDASRLKMMLVPISPVAYKIMPPKRVQWTADFMGVDVHVGENDRDKLSSIMSRHALIFRSQLVIDLFYTDLHRVMTCDPFAKPFTSLQDFLEKDFTQEQFKRGLEGMLLLENVVKKKTQHILHSSHSVPHVNPLQVTLLKQLHTSDGLLRKFSKGPSKHPQLFDKKEGVETFLRRTFPQPPSQDSTSESTNKDDSSESANKDDSSDSLNDAPKP